MDSKERDKRSEDGFGERGEILYDVDERDERNKYREEKIKKRKQRDETHIDSHDESSVSVPVNEFSIRAENPNEYGLDDEEAEDMEGFPDEDEEDFKDEDED